VGMRCYPPTAADTYPVRVANKLSHSLARARSLSHAHKHTHTHTHKPAAMSPPGSESTEDPEESEEEVREDVAAGSAGSVPAHVYAYAHMCMHVHGWVCDCMHSLAFFFELVATWSAESSRFSLRILKSRI